MTLTALMLNQQCQRQCWNAPVVQWCLRHSWFCSFLTLNLTAVGRSAHTFFKGLLFKKSLSAKNWQKIPIPRKMYAESKSRVMFPSKNVNFCLFYASKQAKVLKKPTRCVSHLSRPQYFCPHPGGGLGGSRGWGKAAKQGKNPFTAKTRPFICRLPASQTSEHFLPFTKDVGF